MICVQANPPRGGEGGVIMNYIYGISILGLFICWTLNCFGCANAAEFWLKFMFALMALLSAVDITLLMSLWAEEKNTSAQ